MIKVERLIMNRTGRRSSRGRTEDGSPNPIDVHVGSRVKLRRTLLGLSQEKLGEAIGLTFQQVQKYERGLNRIGASRLFDISKVLEVPIGFFFEEMKEGVAERSPRKLAGAEGFAEEPVNFQYDPMSKRETLELVRAYYKIQDRSVARKVFELVKSLAKSVDGDIDSEMDDEEENS